MAVMTPPEGAEDKKPQRVQRRSTSQMPWKGKMIKPGV